MKGLCWESFTCWLIGWMMPENKKIAHSSPLQADGTPTNYWKGQSLLLVLQIVTPPQTVWNELTNGLLNTFPGPDTRWSLAHKGWNKIQPQSRRGTQARVGGGTKEGQIIYSKWWLLGIPELVKIHKKDWNNIRYAKHICQENAKSFLQSHLFYLTNT